MIYNKLIFMALALFLFQNKPNNHPLTTQPEHQPITIGTANPGWVIHPVPHANNNASDTGSFLNGIEFKCPPNMIVQWPPSAPTKNLTYQDIFNYSIEATCVRK